MNRENVKFMARIFYGVIIIGVIVFFVIKYLNRDKDGGYNIVEKEMTIELGETKQLNLKSKETDTVNYSDYIFESDNNDVASVNTEGLITGLADGKANIDIKDLNGYTILRVKLTVGTGKEIVPLEDQPPEVEEPKEETKKEEPVKEPEPTTKTPPKEEVAKPAEVEVESIELNNVEYTLPVGKTFYLIATINPSSAKDKTLTWESSDSNVVVVKNGRVEAKKVGIATITVTGSNGKTAQCVVTVTQ